MNPVFNGVYRFFKHTEQCSIINQTQGTSENEARIGMNTLSYRGTFAFEPDSEKEIEDQKLYASTDFLDMSANCKNISWKSSNFHKIHLKPQNGPG